MKSGIVTIGSRIVGVFEIFARFLFYLGIVLISAVTVTVLFNVTRRYVLRSPVQWGEELVMALTVGLIMVGLPHCFKTGTFLRVDLVAQLLRPRGRDILEIVNSGIATVFLGVLTLFSFRLMQAIIVRGIRFYMLGVPEWPMDMMFPLGLGTLTIASFIYFVRSVRSWKSH